MSIHMVAGEPGAVTNAQLNHSSMSYFGMPCRKLCSKDRDYEYESLCDVNEISTIVCANPSQSTSFKILKTLRVPRRVKYVDFTVNVHCPNSYVVFSLTKK